MRLPWIRPGVCNTGRSSGVGCFAWHVNMRGLCQQNIASVLCSATVNASRWRSHHKAAEKYKLRFVISILFWLPPSGGEIMWSAEAVWLMSGANRPYRLRARTKVTDCSQKPWQHETGKGFDLAKQGEALFGNTLTAPESIFLSSVSAVIVLCWRVFLLAKEGDRDLFTFIYLKLL